MPHPAAADAAGLLAGWRRGSLARPTWLLDITTDLEGPCGAAVSCDARGMTVATGFAARPNMAAAGRAAVLELCQMELAGAVALAKREEQGEAALGDAERARLRRASELDVTHCIPLYPQGLPSVTSDLPAAEPDASLREVAARLARCGAEAFVVDLTRAGIAVPAAMVLCPALEREPSRHAGERLRAARRRTGADWQGRNMSLF